MSEQAAITARRLLRQLATPPAETEGANSLRELVKLASGVRAILHADDQRGVPSIAVATLHEWRTGLDRLLRDFEAASPAGWAQARQPGTWLDNHLRLRSLLAHEVAKAYWDNKTTIAYASIDIERYLWGAR